MVEEAGQQRRQRRGGGGVAQSIAIVASADATWNETTAGRGMRLYKGRA